MSARRGIELGGDDNHRFFGKSGTEGCEFVLDNFEIFDGVAIVEIAGVDQMRNEARSFDVLQKPGAQARAFVSALDEPRYISDDKGAALARSGVRIRGDDAEMGLERCKWICSDFGPRCGDARNQRGFSGVRETDQADVGEQFQFKAKVAFLTRLTVLVFPGRLMPRTDEM